MTYSKSCGCKNSSIYMKYTYTNSVLAEAYGYCKDCKCEFNFNLKTDQWEIKPMEKPEIKPKHLSPNAAKVLIVFLICSAFSFIFACAAYVCLTNIKLKNQKPVAQTCVSKVDEYPLNSKGWWL